MKFLKSDKLFKTLFFLQLIIITWKIAEDLTEGFRFDSWNVTELLINYEGGFVRRGFLGQIIYFLCDFFHFQPYSVVIFICLICLILYLIIFIKGSLKKNIPVFISVSVLLLASPVFSGNWVRKDILIVLLYVLSLKTFISGKKYLWWISSLIFSVGILIHESLFFITFPVLMFLTIIKSKVSDKKIGNYLYLLLPIVTFVAVCFFKGNHEISNAILDSWNIRDKSVENAVTSLSWSLEFNIRIAFAQGKAFTENGFLFPPLIWMIIVFCVFYLIVNLTAFQNKNNDLLKQRKFLFITTLLQFCTIVPLIILGCDYGRWIFFWSSTSIAAYLFISDQWIILINNSLKIKDSFFLNSSVFTTEKSGLLILLFTLAIPGFVMDSQTYLNSTFIYQIILKLSSIFKIII